MNRQFKVGDIVNASDGAVNKRSMPIDELGFSKLLFHVDGHPFFEEELTLVTPVKSKRGAEVYKDQFAPWVIFKDVTNPEFKPDNENEKIMMLNILILLMTKERQA